MNDGTTLYNGGIFRLFCRVFSSKLFGVVIILFDAPRPPMMFLIVIRYHPPLHHTPLTGGPWWRVDCFIAGFHRLAARLQNSEQCDLWMELFNIEVTFETYALACHMSRAVITCFISSLFVLLTLILFAKHPQPNPMFTTSFAVASEYRKFFGEPVKL